MGERPEVDAGGEGAPLAGHDDHAHRRPGADRRDHLVEIAGKARVAGVQSLGAIEGQARHRARRLQAYRLGLGHEPMVYHKGPCDPADRAPVPAEPLEHVLARRLPRDPPRARARQPARGLAARRRRQRLWLREDDGRHPDRPLPHAPPPADGRDRPRRACGRRRLPHERRPVPDPGPGPALDGRGPRPRDGGRAHRDSPLPDRVAPRLGAQRLRVLRDDRHPLRDGVDRGAAVEPRVELGAPPDLRPAAHRPPGAPRAPPRAAAPPGARRVLVAVPLVMAGASALVGFGTLPLVAAGCALYGLSMAGWMLPLGVLRRETPPEHVAWRTGLYRVCVDGGLFLGPFLAGLLGAGRARVLAGVWAVSLAVTSLPFFIRERRRS